MGGQLEALKQLGLSEGEAKVYLALADLGEASVGEIQKIVKIHRTTIYDYLEKLANKGLVSHSILNRTKRYFPTDPKNILLYVKHKQELAEQVMRELASKNKKMHRLKVEVLSGNQGFRMLLNDILQSGEKEFIGFGIDEKMFISAFPPHYIEKFFKKEMELGIRERMITFEGAEYTAKHKHIQYAFLPKKYFSPIPIAIYANKIAMIVWEPKSVILITNAELADSYRKYFELMWKTCKEK